MQLIRQHKFRKVPTRITTGRTLNVGVMATSRRVKISCHELHSATARFCQRFVMDIVNFVRLLGAIFIDRYLGEDDQWEPTENSGSNRRKPSADCSRSDFAKEFL
ncbi:MAG: hypothetical protein WBF08_01845 [Candidatus Bathyarchaeia archaeon]